MIELIIVLLLLYLLLSSKKEDFKVVNSNVDNKLNPTVLKYMNEGPQMGIYEDTPVFATNDFNRAYKPGIWIENSREYWKYNNTPW